VEAWSDRLGRWSHRQPLSSVWSDRLGGTVDLSASGQNGNCGETWGAGSGGAGSGSGMEAALQESSCRKMSKLFVRRGEAANGKFASSKTTCRETIMLLVEREIETLIAFVISRVSEEDTSGGPGCQCMRCLGIEVGIAGRTEHLQVLIKGGDTMESNIGPRFTDHHAGKIVQ
jgi:hypothetical protein